MGNVNYRYNEFRQTSKAVLITGEALKIPASGDMIVPLREVPKLDLPSTVLVRNAASSSSSNPDQDCSAVQNSNSNDNSDTLYAGRDFLVNGGGLWRTFLRFNIAALPSSPSSVKLRLFVSSTFLQPVQSASFSIHQVTSSWTETGPTWAAQPTYNTSPASAIAITSPGPKDSPSGWYECDITNLYNLWKAGTNNGLLLKGDESAYGTQVRFHSRSNTFQPQLVLVSSGNVYNEVGTYIDPGPGEFACHYGTGRLLFHSSAAGLDLLADYRGTGSPVDANNNVVWLGTTSGTNTITATTETSMALYPGLAVSAKMGGTNTGAATLNINTLGAKPILRLGAAVTSGQLASGVVYDFRYDGTSFHMIGV